MCTCNRKHFEKLGRTAEKQQPHLFSPQKDDYKNHFTTGSSFVNRQLESLQHLHV